MSYAKHIHEEVLERALALGLTQQAAIARLDRPETVGASVEQQWRFLQQSFGSTYGKVPRRMTPQGVQPFMSPASWRQFSEAGRAQMRATSDIPGGMNPYDDPLEQWREGSVSHPGNREQFGLEQALGATPWPIEGGRVRTGLASESKFPKRFKQMTSRYEQVFVRGKPMQRAPWRAGPTARIPERGQVMRTAVLFGPALPEGMSLIEQGLGPAANLRYAQEEIPEGFDPTLAKLGTRWGYRKPISLFEGHAGLSPSDWERHELLDIASRGGKVRALMRREIPLTRGLGLSTHWGKDFLVGADVTKFLGEPGYDIVKSGGFRDVYGAAYSALAAMTPRKFQEITGMEQPKVWSKAASQLVDIFTGSREAMGMRTFDIERVMTRGQFTEFRSAGWNVRKAGSLGGGRYRVKMKVPGMSLDMFTMLTRAGSQEHRTPFIGEHTLAHFKRHAPDVYRQFMAESAEYRSSYAAMSQAYLASRGAGELSTGSTLMTPERLLPIVTAAEQQALEMSGAERVQDVPYGTMMKALLENVPESMGALEFEGTRGRRYFFPNPKHIPRVADTMRETEQAGTFGYELASLMKARAGEDEGAYVSQLARTALAQHRSVSSHEFFRKSRGAIPQTLWGGAAAASYANRPEEVYLPTRIAARASGLRPGTRAYEKFVSEFESGKSIPLAAWREPTTVGESVASLRFHGKWVGSHPVEAFRGSQAPIFSAEAGMAMGGDFDKDDYYIARLYNVDLPTAKRMRRQILSAADLQRGLPPSPPRLSCPGNPSSRSAYQQVRQPGESAVGLLQAVGSTSVHCPFVPGLTRTSTTDLSG